MSEFYRDRVVIDRYGTKHPGLLETLNSKGLSWRASFWNPATRKEDPPRRIPAATQEEAIRYYSNLKGMRPTERPKTTKKKRIFEVGDEWLEWSKKTHGEATYASYKESWNLHIRPVLGNFWMDQVEADPNLVKLPIETMQTLGKFSRKGDGKRTGQPYAADSLLAVWLRISAFFDYTMTTTGGELISVNPCSKFNEKELAWFLAGSRKALQPGDILRDEQIAALVNSEANVQRSRMYEFASETGMRVAEILGLAKEKIDFEENVIWVTHQKSRQGQYLLGLKGDPHRGGGRSRVIPLTVRAEEILHEQFRWQAARGQFGGWVFSNRDGDMLTHGDMGEALRDAYDRAGIERKTTRLWHNFRHAYASRMFALKTEGITLEQVSRWLGHKNIQTTREVYAAILEMYGEVDQLRRAQVAAAEARKLRAV